MQRHCEALSGLDRIVLSLLQGYHVLVFTQLHVPESASQLDDAAYAGVGETWGQDWRPLWAFSSMRIFFLLCSLGLQIEPSPSAGAGGDHRPGSLLTAFPTCASSFCSTASANRASPFGSGCEAVGATAADAPAASFSGPSVWAAPSGGVIGLPAACAAGLAALGSEAWARECSRAQALAKVRPRSTLQLYSRVAADVLGSRRTTCILQPLRMQSGQRGFWSTSKVGKNPSQFWYNQTCHHGSATYRKPISIKYGQHCRTGQARLASMENRRLLQLFMSDLLRMNKGFHGDLKCQSFHPKLITGIFYQQAVLTDVCRALVVDVPDARCMCKVQLDDRDCLGMHARSTQQRQTLEFGYQGSGWMMERHRLSR